MKYLICFMVFVSFDVSVADNVNNIREKFDKWVATLKVSEDVSISCKNNPVPSIYIKENTILKETIEGLNLPKKPYLENGVNSFLLHVYILEGEKILVLMIEERFFPEAGNLKVIRKASIARIKSKPELHASFTYIADGWNWSGKSTNYRK